MKKKPPRPLEQLMVKNNFKPKLST